MKYISGILTGIVGVVLEIHILITCCFIATMVDFITGNIKSFVVARRQNKPYTFRSCLAWRTIWKIIFVAVALFCMHMLDTQVLHFKDLYLANFLAAFVIGVEIWSFLENAAEITQHPVFNFVRKEMQRKLDKELGTKTKEENKK